MDIKDICLGRCDFSINFISVVYGLLTFFEALSFPAHVEYMICRSGISH